VRKTVVFVLCPGHSGSTVLGHFLGAHSRILHVGEIPTPLRRNRPFVCRVCEGPRCPVWGSALDEELVRSCVRQYEAERRWPGPLSRHVRRLLGRRDRRRLLHRRLFERVPGIEVVVDSSKALRWTRWNLEGNDEFRIAILHLTRDLRGVLASHLHRVDPEPVAAVSRALVRSSRAILDFVATLPPQDAMTVRYEDLVREPTATGEALCRFLGVDFEPAMLEYYASEQHVIGGNPGPTYQVRAHRGRRAPELEFLDLTSEANQRFYRELRPGFVEDLRWKQELTGEILDRFEGIAGATNRRLGYPATDS
jgi:hypothetical protein